MLIKKKSAVMTFYYLIAVDKNVTEEEIDTFESVAKEIDPDFYSLYRNTINEEYRSQIEKLIDEEDFFDVILEGVDKALLQELSEGEQGVTPRHLLWNLLVVAFCDGEYSNEERRLIKHVSRMTEIEKDVFLEMEQLMKANVALSKELETIENSERPYNEIRPMVEELNKRREVIVTSAKTLIEDELYVPVDKLEIQKNKVFEDTKNAVDKVASNVANAVSPIATNINDQTKKLFGNIVNTTNKLLS